MQKEQYELEKSNGELLLLGKVFENSLDGIIIADAGGRIVKVNPAFTRITGYSPSEVMGELPGFLRQIGIRMNSMKKSERQYLKNEMVEKKSGEKIKGADSLGWVSNKHNSRFSKIRPVISWRFSRYKRRKTAGKLYQVSGLSMV